MSTAPDVYAKELAHHGLGHPLWIPEPEESGEVLIGDVGFVREGRFRRLFNAMHTKDHPVNGGGVPDGFTPLVIHKSMVETLDQFLPPSAISSESTVQLEGTLGAEVHGVGASFKLEFHRDQAAVLVLGDWAARSTVDDNYQLRHYVRDHHEAWFAFAHARGHVVKRRDIVLVSGWIKSSEWALAACTSSARGHKFSITAGLDAAAKVDLSVHATAEHTLSALQRRRPPVAASADDAAKLPKDQCLFLRFVKGEAKRFSFGSARTKGQPDAPKPRASGRLSQVERLRIGISQARRAFQQSLASSAERCIVEENGGDAEDEVEEAAASNTYSPVDHLIDYILQNSTAEFATASHEDLYKICGSEWPTDFRSYFEHLSLQIDVDDGVGRINHRHTQPPPAISQALGPEYCAAKSNNNNARKFPWSRWEQHSFELDYLRGASLQRHPATLSGPALELSLQTAPPLSLREALSTTPSDFVERESYFGHIMAIALLAHTMSYRSYMNARVPLPTYLSIGAGLCAAAYVGHAYDTMALRSEWADSQLARLNHRSDMMLESLHRLGTMFVDIGLGMRQDVMYS